MDTPIKRYLLAGTYPEMDLHVHGDWVRHSDHEEAVADYEALQRDSARLRMMLAICYSGSKLYGDDGELQDNQELPHIDFKRDSVAAISRAMQARGLAQLARLDAAGQLPAGWKS